MARKTYQWNFKLLVLPSPCPENKQTWILSGGKHKPQTQAGGTELLTVFGCSEDKH